VGDIAKVNIFIEFLENELSNSDFISLLLANIALLGENLVAIYHFFSHF
jgi:hypothetical protein